MKYDKMVEISQEKSREKMEIAERQIQDMLDNKERITVAALIKYTGFSKGFFYENKKMREILNSALLQQGECYNPKKVLLDMEAKQTIVNLKTYIKMLKEKLEEAEIRCLESETENKVLLEHNIKLKKEIEWLTKV